jgi:hypothetical protein
MTNTSPWAISDKDAKARDLAAVMLLEETCVRCLDAEMPKDTKRMKLATRGYGTRELRRLMAMPEARR